MPQILITYQYGNTRVLTLLKNEGPYEYERLAIALKSHEKNNNKTRVHEIHSELGNAMINLDNIAGTRYCFDYEDLTDSVVAELRENVIKGRLFDLMIKKEVKQRSEEIIEANKSFTSVDWKRPKTMDDDLPF